MRKSSKFTAFALFLSLFCTLLSGCGTAEAPPAAEESAAPVMCSFYGADFTELAPETDRYLGARACTDGGFYAVDYDMQDADDGGTAEYATAISFVSYSGTVKRLEKYKPVQPPEELAGMPDFYCTHELEGLALDGEGNLVTVESLYMSWYAGTGQRRDEYATAYDDNKRSMYVRRLDKQGRELSCAELDLAEDDNVYAHDLKIDSLGNIVLSEQSRLRFFSLDGKETGRIELGGYVRTVLQNDNGDIAAVSYDARGDELLSYISVEDMNIESSAPIPDGCMYLCLGDGEYDLYYSDGWDYYGYALDTGRSTGIFNWLSCGVNVNTLSNVELSEDGFRAVSNSYSTEKQRYVTELVEISLKTLPEDQMKKGLTLGCIEADNELVDRVIAFNRQSEDSFINVTEYCRSFDLTAEGQKGRLMTELLSGNMPDILVLDGINHRLLASKGLLADLSPYLDADEKLSREDIFPNVLQSCTIGGRLYALAENFSIDTVLADGSLVGFEPGWTYEQYYQTLALMENPECTPFEVYTTSQELLRSGLAMELDSYIDWEELTADFENESFLSLLSFADTFPDSFDWENYAWSDADIIEYRIAGGRQMLLRTSLLSIEEIFYNSIYFNGQTSYIGYPSHDGSVGNMLVLDRLCAIGENSEHKDEAWQFIRSLLMDEGETAQWGFPSNRRVYEKRLEAMMTPSYLTDEENQPVLTEEGEQIELAQGHMGTVLGVRGFYSLSEEQADQLTLVLSSCEKLKFQETELIDLIVETCQPYFEAWRGAENTAAQVEKAVENYLLQYK